MVRLRFSRIDVEHNLHRDVTDKERDKKTSGRILVDKRN